jgi:ribosomal protein L20
MRQYLVDLVWDHKGGRYPKCHTARISASSVPSAIARAYRDARQRNRGSIREVAETRIRATVTVIGEKPKQEGEQ